MRLAILALLCVTHTTFADTETYFTVQPGNPPVIEATLIGAPKTTLDKISLATTGPGGTKIVVKPDKVRPYNEGKETIAIALVINGQEIWVGNDDVETDDNAKYPGVLKSLSAAIDKLDFATNAPPGSLGMIVSYSQGTDPKLPMGDLKKLNGAALGTQKDYRGKIGTDMVQGISYALAELSKVATARKALIVVGDGNDTNAETARTALADLKRQAIAQHVQMFAIIYKDQISSEASVITNMIPNAKTVSSNEGVASELDNIIVRMADRYYVTFPGATLPWDGKEHPLAITVDATELEPQDVALAPKWAPRQGRQFPWLAILIPMFVLGCIGIVMSLRGRRVAMPMVPVLPTPGPFVPVVVAEPVMKRTAMMNSQATDDGFPVVGWLVPMNGNSAFRTMKLKQGLTKIGTGGSSDLVIDDGFMSTEHCQITSSPQGFQLKDGGSTNGCYVNDKKIHTAHELFDNDELLLGKTRFRFKTIN
ncbi:MAG: FHA domain-containing protein [Kofleriaceae bacterium]